MLCDDTTAPRAYEDNRDHATGSNLATKKVTLLMPPTVRGCALQASRDEKSTLHSNTHWQWFSAECCCLLRYHQTPPRTAAPL